MRLVVGETEMARAVRPRRNPANNAHRGDDDRRAQLPSAQPLSSHSPQRRCPQAPPFPTSLPVRPGHVHLGPLNLGYPRALSSER
jgi:hypothetical protein